jgi:hypothetical protein
VNAPWRVHLAYEVVVFVVAVPGRAVAFICANNTHGAINHLWYEFFCMYKTGERGKRARDNKQVNRESGHMVDDFFKIKSHELQVGVDSGESEEQNRAEQNPSTNGPQIRRKK